ncbi:MAG: flavodoxin [Cellulosilyticaceae bacterium]
MSKIAVVFWSGTGNTREMAELIVQGAKTAGGDVTLFAATEFSLEKMDEYDKIAFGCPAMGGEELEEDEFLPMFIACESKLKDKSIALFGAYGWGDGEWMRNWEDTCKEKGALLIGESVIANEGPDANARKACLELGKNLACK